MNPRISYIVLAHNRAEFLLRCLSSISAQVYDKPIETIIVDDASDDGTDRMACMWADADEHRHYLPLKKPAKGIGAASAAGLGRATGTYVGRIDSDDWVSRYYSAVMATKLDSDPTAGLAVCDYTMNRDNHRPIVCTGETLACNVLWRADYLRSIGGWNPACITGEDKDVLSRVDPACITRVPFPLYRYWQHGGQVTREAKQ